jgi:hypothetical protein
MELAVGDGSSYACVKRSQAREGFGMDSPKAGVVEVGTQVAATEVRANEGGTLRIHFEGGWVSEYSGKGDLCFELVETAVVAPGAAAPESELKAEPLVPQVELASVELGPELPAPEPAHHGQPPHGPGLDLEPEAEGHSGGRAITIQFCSDMHLELPREPANLGQHLSDCVARCKGPLHATADGVRDANLLPAAADCLALLGDIFDGKRLLDGTYRAWLVAQAAAYEVVFVLAGNHEFYRAEAAAVRRGLRALCAEATAELRGGGGASTGATPPSRAIVPLSRVGRPGICTRAEWGEK